MPVEPSRSLIFDLDGTLIDSFNGIAQAFRHMCRQLNFPMMTDEAVREGIGPPIRDTISRAFHLSPAEVERAVSAFRSYYGSQGWLEFEKYPGVDTLLNSLNSEGFGIYLATNKPSRYAARIVDAAGWKEVIFKIGGTTLNGSRRDKLSVLQWLLEHRVNHEPIAAFVGDQTEDMKSGCALSLRCLGAGWGYSTSAALIQAGAEAVAESPAHVMRLVLS